MGLFVLIRTASREANELAAGSAILLLIKILLLNRLPGLFPGAYELGVIVEAILASVIASYVFYLLVVHIKELTDQRVIQPYLQKQLNAVLGSCTAQLSEISKASGIRLDPASLTEEDVKSAFTHIAPYSDAPLLISAQTNQHANWFQYFTYYENRTKQGIRRLLDQLPFLDASLVSSVAQIDDSMHFVAINFVLSNKVRNEDLSAWSSTFFDYTVLCRNLRHCAGRLGFQVSEP